MLLELAGCRVRSFVDADASSLAALLDDRRVSINLRDRVPHPYTVADAEAFVVAARTAEPELAFAIDVEGVAIGCVGLHPREDVYHRTLELGFWLGVPYWGRGIATQVVCAMRAWAFAERAPARLEAEVFGWNQASARVLEKAGFTHEATLRRAVTKAGRGTADLLVYSALSAD